MTGCMPAKACSPLQRLGKAYCFFSPDAEVPGAMPPVVLLTPPGVPDVLLLPPAPPLVAPLVAPPVAALSVGLLAAGGLPVVLPVLAVLPVVELPPVDAPADPASPVGVPAEPVLPEFAAAGALAVPEVVGAPVLPAPVDPVLLLDSFLLHALNASAATRAARSAEYFIVFPLRIDSFVKRGALLSP